MVLILNCGSTKIDFIEEIVDGFCDFKTVPILDFNEQDIKKYSGVIISGAPLLITEQNIAPFLEKIIWVKNTTIPVLGICFGHQLIGLTFGAFASRMREDRDWQTIEVYENCSLFDKLPTEFEMMEDHCETISIPPGFQLVASSDACVNEAMQHLSMPIFGVQFHPEVSGNLGSVVIENFIKLTQKNEGSTFSL
jgi:GMP synthase (glutamine-hydrolysing)